MSYFTFDAPLTRLTVARAEAVNALFQGVADSFADLPASDAIAEGRATFAVAAGTANAITLPSVSEAEYVVGRNVRFITTAANTGAVTINVGGIGVRSLLRPNGDPLAANDFAIGQIVDATYDGSAFRVVGFVGSDLAAAEASAAAALVSENATAPVIPYLTDISDVAAQIAAVGIVSGSIANVEAVAALGSDVTTVADVSASVSTVATNIADVVIVADNIADVNTAAATVTGAGLAADIATVAGLNTEIATLGPISADISTVAANDADVTTVATNISDVTNFSDVYLGPSATEPTLRNDGSALIEGDMYFDTVGDIPRFWTGAAWVGASGAGFLETANNLSDVPNKTTARSNLGLSTVVYESRSVTGTGALTGGGDLSGNRTLDISPTTEARLVLADNAAPKARVIATTNGLTGGGNLTTNRTLQVDSTVVRTTRTVNSGAGLTGGGSLAANRTLSLDSDTLASLVLADNAVPTARSVVAGTGLNGGGTLTTSRTINMDSDQLMTLANVRDALRDATTYDATSTILARQDGYFAISGFTYQAGDIVAGSDLRRANLSGGTEGGGLPGSWLRVGAGFNPVSNTNQSRTTTFRRV